MVEIRDWLIALGWSDGWAVVGAIATGIVLAWVATEAARLVGKGLLANVARPKRKWVVALERHRVLRGFAWVVIVIITDSLIAPLLQPWPKTATVVQTLLNGAIVVTVAIALSRLITAVITALETQEGSQRRLPVKVLGQAVQIVVWTYATIVLLSVLSHRDVTTLLTGLTAVGAVLVYVFRDPILGWTAGVQIAANDLTRLGDWITVPKHDADGYVVDIALTTIKVRNWDKTISTIPSYALVSDGFRNWRGMYESGGRRIKRSIAIDATSVRFCDEALLERLRSEGLLHTANESKQTNLACFRYWLESWLADHPQIHHGMTTMVRELAPDGRGIPVEVYAFSKDTGWVSYEHLQADVIDEVVAVLPRFDLRVFQEPTGDDVRKLASTDEGKATGR
jgi:miniconductance mechanosensitive channel